MTVCRFEENTPEIHESVYLASSAEIIGQVRLEADVSIWPGAVVRGDVNQVRIGAGSNVQDGSVLHVSHAGGQNGEHGHPLDIAENVTIGHRAVVHGCTVGRSCLVGIGSIVMDGAVLEDYVMLGAGSLVPPGKRLVSGHLYVGTPARQVRPLSHEEMEYLDYSAGHYIALKNRYLAMAQD